MNQKITRIVLILVSLFATQSALGLGDRNLSNPKLFAKKTELADKQAQKERIQALIKQGSIVQQKMMQGKINEDQALDVIYGWLNNQTIDLRETVFLIKELDLQELHEKRKMVAELRDLKVQLDSKKIAKKWFKRYVKRTLNRAYAYQLINKQEKKNLEYELGITSIFSRVREYALSSLKWGIRVWNLKRAIEDGKLAGALLYETALYTKNILQSDKEGVLVGNYRNKYGVKKDIKISKAKALEATIQTYGSELVESIGSFSNHTANLLVN